MEEETETGVRQLPIPPHFQPDAVGTVWRVPYQERADEAGVWGRRHQIPPAAADTLRVCLVIVDCQNTFCIPGYELFVAGASGLGAVEDNLRLCLFLYRNLDVITEIVPTLDTHTPAQIFHSLFWVNAAGEHPGPHTAISPEDVETGRWQANPALAGSLTGGDAGRLQRHAVH